MFLPRFERRERALALRVRALVLERGLDLLARPVSRSLLDVRDRQVGVILHQLRGGLGLLRRSGLLRGAADRLDLDLRELGAEAGMPAVARLGAVLADAELLAERRADHAGGHLRLRSELERAVAAEHQHLRMEGLALFRRQAVDEQALAFLNAVL